MSQKTSIESVGVSLTSSLDEQERGDHRAAPEPDSPFRILVLGDFSGRESRGIRSAEDLGVDRLPVRVDRDNLESLPETLGARAAIQLVRGGPTLDIPIRRLEDLHPDGLFEGTAAFAGLRRTRIDLRDPEGYERAATEVRSWERLKDGGAADVAAALTAEGSPEGADLVSELLERSQAAADKDNDENPENAFNRFVQQVVAPYQAPAEASDRDELVARTEDAIGSWMRDFLHHPRLQALEAAWRGLAFLVGRLETDGSVEVHVLDITRDELSDSLRATADLSNSAIHEIFAATGPWSLFAGLFTFDRSLRDIALLGRLGKVASASGAPFLAAGNPLILEPDRDREEAEEEEEDDGEDEEKGPPNPVDESLWAALRDLPESRFLGLALPRFLLRLPYGAATEPLEQFPFEEMKNSGYDALLWGNPAIACAVLIAQAFEKGGWRFHPGLVRDLEELPLYVRAADGRGDAVATPCAETLLSDDAAQKILERGLIPLVSLRGRDVIRIPKFQSIASPARALGGPWERGGGRES